MLPPHRNAQPPPPTTPVTDPVGASRRTSVGAGPPVVKLQTGPSAVTSGGSGTNGFVSAYPALLFHFRLNCASSQSKTQGLVVKMLCSRCVSLEGDVQFDEPKIDMLWLWSITAFS